MSNEQRRLRLRLPEPGLEVRIDLHETLNPATCELVWESMPLESIVGHVVVSGGGLWIPTRAIHLGPRAALRRTRGSVYFYPPMQSICITYGDVSESAYVNEFARVCPDDLGILSNIGKYVWDRTIIEPHCRIARVTLQRDLAEVA